MKIRHPYFKIVKCNPLIKLLAISISLLIAIQSVDSSQSPQQGAKVSHQQSTLTKDRTEEGDSTGPSQSAGKYSTKTYSPSSNYYVYPNSPYNGYYNNPLSDPYYDGYYERPSRQISARSSTYPMLAAASSQVGFAEPEYGGLAAATGHNSHGHGGHGGNGGGHGGGWGGWSSGGHGYGHHITHYESVSKVDTSSLGLLGLLGLLSLLSNVLNLITTTAAAATPAPTPAPGRKRRAVMIEEDEIQFEEDGLEKNRIVRVCERILPSLNVIGHAQNRHVPINCTHQEVCKTNKILMDELGVQGRAAGSVMSKAILKMLSDVDKTGKHDKYLLKASLDGRNGLDCEIVYPTCETLQKSPKALPQLLSPEQVSKIVHGQNPHILIPKIFAFP